MTDSSKQTAEIHVRRTTIDDAAAIARVQIRTWHDTYRGIIPDSYLVSMSEQQNTERWNRILNADTAKPSERLSLVASTKDFGVVGFVSGGPERDKVDGYTGELYAIYVLKEFQGSGCGKKLFTEFSKQMKQLGYPDILIWVLTDNPSTAFYTKMGGIEVRRKIVDIGGKALEETGYGFKL